MLYLVPTPVGNLEDITLRAIRVLKEADLIACEDTRRTAVLLSHYHISTPVTSYHDHNERRKAPQLVKRMLDGESVALVTDAGSPGISDPGFFLVRACCEAGLSVTALPGATALVPALTASGLPSDRFAFEGFLPVKKGRKARLQMLSGSPCTVVLYESPHRLVKTLADLATVLGPARKAAVGRELTKVHEEMRRGPLDALHAHYAAQPSIRGEIVIVVAPDR